MSLFTAANAKEMAAKSHASRKAAAAERFSKPLSIPQIAPSPAEIDSGVNVASVRERLETIDRMMARAKTHQEFDCLTRAYDRMFRVLCVLTNTPGPGNRKPASLRKSSPTWRSEPLPPLQAGNEVATALSNQAD
jgi:hypothetical protein